MGLNPFKIKAGCCIYLWTKKEETNNEQHRLFFLFPSAIEVVFSGEEDLFKMHGFWRTGKSCLLSKQQLPLLHAVAEIPVRNMWVTI